MKRPTPLPNPLDAVYAAGLVLASPVLGYRLLRTGKWRSDWRGRLGHAPELEPDTRPTVLLHGVSVGEVAAAAPLVEALGGPSGAGPTHVVVSATTDTGFQRASALYGADYDVVRYPLDFNRAVQRFLDRVRPDAVALLELEVWPNFMRACAARGIPVVVVNGRLSEGSFRGYRRLRALLAPSFARLSGVAAQTEAYAERFRAMGVPADRVVVTDSMKWEGGLPADVRERGRRLAAGMGIDLEQPVVVAVSTGPGEERLLLEGRPDGVQLVVVPRKPERFDEVAGLAGFVRRSRAADEVRASENRADESGGASVDSTGLFLVDTMGEAEAATSIADVVVVGRSFNGMGGSNPIPAAMLGRPAVIGPDHQNFDQVVEALTSGGALTVTRDPWSEVQRILAAPEVGAAMSRSGPDVVARHAGATGRNVEVIRAQLKGFAEPA